MAVVVTEVMTVVVLLLLLLLLFCVLLELNPGLIQVRRGELYHEATTLIPL